MDASSTDSLQAFQPEIGLTERVMFIPGEYSIVIPCSVVSIDCRATCQPPDVHEVRIFIEHLEKSFAPRSHVNLRFNWNS